MPSLGSDLRRTELGENGRRMAVGTSDNTIHIYDLITTPVHPSSETMAWKFAGRVSDIDVVNFSLSPDGRFLATRHKSIAKQVQVWEIASNGNGIASPIDTEESNEVEFSLEAKNIGTFWCTADGESVKLFQTESSLILAMSCETWLSNRGKVQVFVRDLSSSSPNPDDSTWSEPMSSLEGKNTGDRCGSALSISDSSPEYNFRIAIGCPGYNNNQGLVLVYGASRETLITWEQTGNDLIGSKVGERFGAALDMSVNTQPYLLVGSPGWNKTTHIGNNGEGFDPTNGQGQSETIGSGLVRLFHWRRSGSSLRSPRGWVMVGDPMSGRNGDQFGSHVVISRTGERIAIAASPVGASTTDIDQIQYQPKYIGVYERQSWNSWGLLVNEVVSSGDSRGTDILPRMALNDWGSMLVTVASNGSVKTLIDDSPFCGIPTIKTSHLGHGESRAPELPDSDVLLGRQTCRTKDTLVENQSVCSEQQVYIGRYEACLWRDISIAAFPSIAPSIAPAVAPSSSPSSITSPTQSETPSLGPNKFVSFSPSASAFTPPTFTSAQPSLQNSASASGRPSILGTFHENESSSLPSTFPTPLEVPSSLRFSSHPSTTATATTTATKQDHDETSLLNSCHCNIFDECIDRPLSESSPELRICVFAGARIVSLESAGLYQGDFSLSMIYGGVPIHSNANGNAHSECIRTGTSTGRSPSPSPTSMCRMETTVGSVFFGRNRPSWVVLEGKALVEVSVSHPLDPREMGIRQRTIPFSNRISLQEPTSVLPTSFPTNRQGNNSNNNNQTAKRFLGGGTAAFVLLLALSVFGGWCCKKYFCRSDNEDDTKRVEDFFGIA
eukprot:jgi/Psemu1/11052/gm1.11052_g